MTKLTNLRKFHTNNQDLFIRIGVSILLMMMFIFAYNTYQKQNKPKQEQKFSKKTEKFATVR